MNLSVLLDVAIGVAFIYFLLSLIASAIQEIIAGVFTWRGTYLSKGIDVILDNRDTAKFQFVNVIDWLRAHFTPRVGRTVADETKRVIAEKVKQTGKPATEAELTLQKVVDVQRHPLVRSTPTTVPSYLPSRNFALALLEVLRDGSRATMFSQAETTVAKLPDGDLKTTLGVFLQDAGGDLDKFRAHIEQWFDDSMARVGGVYKRFSQYVMLVIGFSLAAGLNVDSFHVVRTLWETPSMRTAVVEQATEAVKAGNQAATPPDISKVQADLRAFEEKQFPAGWAHWCEAVHPGDPLLKAPPPSCDKWDIAYYAWHSLLGWIATAIAISLGAPFWFDLLQNFTNIRHAGTKPDRADETRPPAATR